MSTSHFGLGAACVALLCVFAPAPSALASDASCAVRAGPGLGGACGGAPASCSRGPGGVAASPAMVPVTLASAEAPPDRRVPLFARTCSDMRCPGFIVLGTGY